MKYLKKYENIFSNLFKKNDIDPNKIYVYKYEDFDISPLGEYSSNYRLIVCKITKNDKDYNKINGYYLDNNKPVSMFIIRRNHREATPEEIDIYNQLELKKNHIDKFNL